MLIHVSQDQQQDHGIEGGNEHGIIITERELEAITQRLGDGREADTLQAIGEDGVHAEILEPVESTAPTPHIDHIIADRHQGTADTSGQERHRVVPDLLVDRGDLGKGKGSHNEKHGGQKQIEGAARRCGLAIAEQVTGETSHNAGNNKVETAQDPGVSIVGIVAPGPVSRPDDAIAMTAQYGFVDPHCHIVLDVRCPLAIERKAEEIGDKAGNSYSPLATGSAIDIGYRCHCIRHSNGLKGIGKRMEQLEVEPEQIALHDHAQEPEDHDAAKQLEPESSIRPLPLPIAGHRERYGDARHEHEERHDDVPRHKARPGRVFALHTEEVTHRSLRHRHIALDDRTKKQKQKEVEASQYIKGCKSLFFHIGMIFMLQS